VSDSILEEAGITGDVNIADLPVYFLPLEQDVLSLELDTSFGDLYLVSLILFRSIGLSLQHLAQKSRQYIPLSQRLDERSATPWIFPSNHW
jgi:hypothetical protein